MHPWGHPSRTAGSYVSFSLHTDLHGDLHDLGSHCPCCLRPHEDKPARSPDLQCGVDGPVPSHCQRVTTLWTASSALALIHVSNRQWSVCSFFLPTEEAELTMSLLRTENLPPSVSTCWHLRYSLRSLKRLSRGGGWQGRLPVHSPEVGRASYLWTVPWSCPVPSCHLYKKPTLLSRASSRLPLGRMPALQFLLDYLGTECARDLNCMRQSLKEAPADRPLVASS